MPYFYFLRTLQKMSDSYEIQRENEPKRLFVSPVENSDNEVNDIKFSRERDNKNTEDDGTLGLNYLANTHLKREDSEEERVHDDHESESRPEDQELRWGNFEEPNQLIGRSYEDIQYEKAGLLAKLKRLERKGIYASKRLSMEHELEEIKNEIQRMTKEKEVENGVEFCKTGFVMCIQGLEMLNTKYDPFDMDLEGWNQHICSNMHTFEDYLEQIYERYHSDFTVNPILGLGLAVAQSAFVFNLSKKMSIKAHSEKKKAVKSAVNNLTGQHEMKGPNLSREELFRKLHDAECDSDATNMTHESIYEKIIPQETKTVVISEPAKKTRGGRKKKERKD